MADSVLLARASDCLAALRNGLDGSALDVEQEDAPYAWYAIPLLCRGVFLCEAAVNVAKTDDRAAAATLIRPAIECWVDTCYAMYCKHEAVLRLGGANLASRETIARAWLEDLPDELIDQRTELDEVAALGRSSGMLDESFDTPRRMPVDQRLRAAIKCRGASDDYMQIYDVLYRSLSLTEMHTGTAVDTNATISEVRAEFRVTPTELHDVDVIVAITSSCLCDAGLDAFSILRLDTEDLKRRRAELHYALAPRAEELVAALGETGYKLKPHSAVE